jgi:hypothetical protein
MPVVVMSTSGLKRNIRPRQLMTLIEQLRSYGDYIKSGENADSPDVRRAKIRAGAKALLLMAEPDIPIGALAPYLDYAAAKIASETVLAPG